MRWLVPLYLLTICSPMFGQTPETSFQIKLQDSGVNASFRGLAVRNRKEAWATGTQGTVVRTTDAGETWTRIRLPDSDALDFRDIALLPNRTVLIMSVGDGKASRILRSTDNGESWQVVLLNSDPTGFFDGMAFDRQGRRGVLFGDPVDGRLSIFRTADGGESWVALPTKQRPRLADGEYGFAASGSGVRFQDDNIWIATGGSVARVFRSTDGGEEWSVAKTPLRSGNESSGIFSLAALSSQSLVIIGGDYKQPEKDKSNVSRSMDGGRTWEQLNSVRMPHKACVQFLGDGRLLTCGRTGVALSYDAGKTWREISAESFYVFGFDPESGTGFLAGAEGRIARFDL